MLHIGPVVLSHGRHIETVACRDELALLGPQLVGGRRLVDRLYPTSVMLLRSSDRRRGCQMQEVGGHDGMFKRRSSSTRQRSTSADQQFPAFRATEYRPVT